jgi:hypothetical protein
MPVQFRGALRVVMPGMKFPSKVRACSIELSFYLSSVSMCNHRFLPAQDRQDSIAPFIAAIAGFEQASEGMKGADEVMDAAKSAAADRGGRVRQEILPKLRPAQIAPPVAVSATGEIVPLPFGAPGPGVGREREAEREQGRTFSNWALQVPSDEWLQRRSNCHDGQPLALTATCPVSAARDAAKRELSREVAEEREEKAAVDALKVRGCIA